MNLPSGNELPKTMSVMLAQASRWKPVMDGYRFVAKIDRCLIGAATLPDELSHRRTLASLELAEMLEGAAAIAQPHYPGTSRIQLIQLIGGMLNLHADGLMAEPRTLELWEHTEGKRPNRNVPGYYHKVKRPAPMATLGRMVANTCSELSQVVCDQRYTA